MRMEMSNSSVVISMLVGSRQSTRALVENAVQSVLSHIGTTDFLMVIGVAPYTQLAVRKKIKKYANEYRGRIIVLWNCQATFAHFTNNVIRQYLRGFKWFLVCHDDIELNSNNFIPSVEQSLIGANGDIGWISITDDDYLNGHWAPSTRPGWHTDNVKDRSWQRRKIFQFHNLNEGWLRGRIKKPIYYRRQKYDFPHSAVKCHAPFSHFILIEIEKLRAIGFCEKWSPVSLLIDEDWGLSAMQAGMYNVWIPNLSYTHRRGQFGATRAGPLIKEYAKGVHEKFYRKWGHIHNETKTKTLRRIKNVHRHTNIPWSIGRLSYDWDYV